MGKVKERVGILGLAAFLLVDAVLVAMALGSTHTPVSGAGTTVGATTSATSTRTSSSPPTSAPTTSAAPARVAVAPLTVGIVAVDQDTAVRFTVGSCDKGGGAVELSRDAGASWTPLPKPFDAVVRVRVRGDKSAFAVGADTGSDCEPAIRQSPNLKGEWADAAKVGDAWFRDPRDPQSVGLPTGGTGKPCAGGSVVDLAVVDAGAGVLCASGEVVTTKSGSQWDPAGAVDGALAIALDGKAQPYAVVPGAGSCAGLAVVTPTKPAEPVGCVKLDLAKVSAGSVALSVAGDAGWLRVGQAVYRADGSLTSWKSV